jgi:hypothetical protein
VSVRNIRHIFSIGALVCVSSIALLGTAGFPGPAIGSELGNGAQPDSGADRFPRSLDPSLDIRLFGQTGASGFPAVLASFTPSPVQPDLRSATIVLPPVELLALEHLRSVCDAVSFAADTCPDASAHGRITAWTPVSPVPLRAPIYLLQSAGKLPSLAAHIGDEFDLVASLDTPRGRFRIRVGPLPQVPVSRFLFRLEGGSRGLFQNSERLCGERHYARATFSDHQGTHRTVRAPVTATC